MTNYLRDLRVLRVLSVLRDSRVLRVLNVLRVLRFPPSDELGCDSILVMYSLSFANVLLFVTISVVINVFPLPSYVTFSLPESVCIFTNNTRKFYSVSMRFSRSWQ